MNNGVQKCAIVRKFLLEVHWKNAYYSFCND